MDCINILVCVTYIAAAENSEFLLSVNFYDLRTLFEFDLLVVELFLLDGRIPAESY